MTKSNIPYIVLIATVLAAQPAYAQYTSPVYNITPTTQPGVGQSWNDAERQEQQQQQIQQQQQQLQQQQNQINQYNVMSPSQRMTYGRGF